MLPCPFLGWNGVWTVLYVIESLKYGEQDDFYLLKLRNAFHFYYENNTGTIKFVSHFFEKVNKKNRGKKIESLKEG